MEFQARMKIAERRDHRVSAAKLYFSAWSVRALFAFYG